MVESNQKKAVIPLVHVEAGGTILCGDLGLIDCDWRNVEVMYDEITCLDCIRIAKQRFEEVD